MEIEAMTLREIAEHVNNGNCLVHRDDLAFLLNAVVEEKALCLRAHEWIENADKGIHGEISYWRTQALDELNLEGVWPRKKEGK